MNDEIIQIKSNNDYAKKFKKIAMILVAVSLVVFVVLMLFFNDNKYTFLAVADIALFVVSVCLLIFAFAIQKTEITVTDKRVYGITTFGKRVDLPFDSISAVGISAFKGIAIGTSSGRIVFKGIGNRDEIHNAISNLLIERQKKANVVAAPITTIKQEIPQSNADELKKYKELLESGIITQEEFDKKKKELLGF